MIQSQKFSKLEPKHSYFDKIDTELKAYLLGFFIADGYVTIDYANSAIRNPTYRLGLLNSVDDLEIIEKFNEEICPRRELHFSNNQKGALFRKPQVSFRWTSRYMHTILSSMYNIIPQKTKNYTFKFPFEKVPKQLLHHFVRGFFDGDGNVTFHRTKNISTNSTIQFNFSFVFTSKVFAEQIAEVIETIDSQVTRTLRQVKSKNMLLYVLRFNCKRDRYRIMLKIYDWLYKDSNIFLTRKRKKFDEYFKYRANFPNNRREVA